MRLRQPLPFLGVTSWGGLRLRVRDASACGPCGPPFPSTSLVPAEAGPYGASVLRSARSSPGSRFRWTPVPSARARSARAVQAWVPRFSRTSLLCPRGRGSTVGSSASVRVAPWRLITSVRPVSRSVRPATPVGWAGTLPGASSRPAEAVQVSAAFGFPRALPPPAVAKATSLSLPLRVGSAPVSLPFVK